MVTIERVIENVKQYKDKIDNEQSTIQTLILPFFQMLGYDIFNPHEVAQQYTANVPGSSKSTKVDLAILINEKPMMIVECKPCNENLGKHSGQLYKYFIATKARFAILTNGIVYQFFTDLDDQNLMDKTPFLEIDMLDIKDGTIAEIMKFKKEHFDVDNILTAAQGLKYARLVKDWLHKQTHEPDKEFIKLIIREAIHADKNPKPAVSQKMLDSLTSPIRHSFLDFLNEQATGRLQAAIKSTLDDEPNDVEASVEDEAPEKNTIETTLEEFEAYAIVKSILRDMIDVNRLAYRHAQKYMAVLLDDNKNKRICRFWFRGRNKHITTPDKNMSPIRHDIANLNEIYNYSEQIREVCERHLK